MKVIHGSCSDDYETSDFKTCPICGATCFADMDTCFGCLHHFDEDEAANTPIHEADREQLSEMDPSRAPSPEDLVGDARLSSLFVNADDLQSSKKTAYPIERDDAAHGIPSLQKPKDTTESADRPNVAIENEEGLPSRHVCSDKEGHQFEISISVKLL